MVGHDLKVGHQMCPHLSSHSCILTMYMYFVQENLLPIVYI